MDFSENPYYDWKKQIRVAMQKFFSLFLLLLIAPLFAHIHEGQPAAIKDVIPFALKQNKNFQDHVFIENAFTPEECAKIIDYGLKIGLYTAEVGEKDKATVTNTIRKSRVAWLRWSPEIDWVFERLTKYAKQINHKHYKFDLSGFFEKLQFTEYLAPDSHYSWHMDLAEGELSRRKLSLVVQLSSPDDYQGGELQFFAEPLKIVPKKHGALTIFPSYMYHRVTPITKGKRYTLVVWISGHPFR